LEKRAIQDGTEKRRAQRHPHWNSSFTDPRRIGEATAG
jgi:hypothetical protein